MDETRTEKNGVESQRREGTAQSAATSVVVLEEFEFL
jgi:hypothetical protein